MARNFIQNLKNRFTWAGRIIFDRLFLDGTYTLQKPNKYSINKTTGHKTVTFKKYKIFGQKFVHATIVQELADQYQNIDNLLYDSCSLAPSESCGVVDLRTKREIWNDAITWARMTASGQNYDKSDCAIVYSDPNSLTGTTVKYAGR